MALKTNAPKLPTGAPQQTTPPAAWWDARTRDELREQIAIMKAQRDAARELLEQVGRQQVCGCTPASGMHDERCYVSRIWRFLGWL